MSSSESQEILNKVLNLLTDFAKIDVSGFDISEERKLYIDSITVLFGDVFKDGIAIKFSFYLDEPVYVLVLISREAVYELSNSMGINIDEDFEKVRYDENALSFTVEIANLMTASVADRYARKLNKRVLYSPPKIVRHLFSPDIIKGIDIKNRMANIIVYEFILSRPDSAIKMLLIY
jgi:chemotaxis protein CheY-P-specific phosphatase CheC